MTLEDKYWFNKVKYRVLEGKDGIRYAYNCMADLYDSSKYLYWTRKIETGEEKIIDKWIKKIDGICLDIGCGTGRYALKIAEKNIEVVALDISKNMLKKMLEKAEERNISNKIYSIIADGEMLPLRDKSFRSIICTLTFNHFMNPDNTAKEFSRVLKKNSICIISSLNSYTLKYFQNKYGFGDRVPFRTEKMFPVLIYEKGYSVDEFKKIFLKYGFKVKDLKGTCYWHLLPAGLFIYYPQILELFFNLFKNLLRYAEAHVMLLYY
ncbi:MAG: hypothetical protein DRJ45_04485 [Thermoprotei archaeon]|nr:MAG: hypothetical protein DRJ45_04485 [Thermoprotei archaeon]